MPVCPNPSHGGTGRCLTRRSATHTLVPVNVALAALALLVQATATADPAAVVRRAQLAVEADSAARAASAWQSALARDSNDVAALLGLATIARLTYDYPRADGYYAAIARRSGGSGRFAAWATLG